MLAQVRDAIRGRPILALAVGWTATRLLLLAQLAIFSDAFIGDVRLYALWASVLGQGQFPVGDPFWQYPPGAGVLFAGLDLFGGQPVVAFIGLALVADAGILAMLCATIARAPTAARSWWGPAAWVVGGLAIGPVMLARFDLFPTAFAVAAILLATRPGASGAMAAVGGLLKAWPILVLFAIPRRGLPAAGLAALAVGAIGALSIAVWAPGSMAFLSEQQARGLQIESVGALGFMLAGAIGRPPEIVLRYGAFEVQADWVEELGLALTCLGIILIVALAGLRLLGRLEAAPGGDIALLAVLISVASSRVLSPQYSVWLIGVAVAATCNPRSSARRATWLLIAMAAVTQVLFPWCYGSYLDAATQAVGLQALRIGLLVWAISAIGVDTLRPALTRGAPASAGPPPRPGHQS